MKEAFEKILERLSNIYRVVKTDEDAEWNRAIYKSTKIVKEVAEEQNNGWIPCSERLPECGIKVLVQYGCGRINIEECKKNTDGIIGFYDGNYWSNADNYISWQPLPEPYKPPM